MVPSENRTADRWLQRSPNATIFTLLGVMVLAIVLGAVFYLAVRPHAGGDTQQKPSQNQPTQAHPQ